jgi:YegS/Rv2252/BmrU family lipid kinase
MAQAFDSGPITVVINTDARAGQELDAGDVRRAFAAHGRQAQVHGIQGGQIADAVRSSLDDGARVVVAAGGDGTVNAVAAELVGRDEAALAVLPTGTLNHFARDLGLPSKMEDAVAVIAKGLARTIDVGDVNGHVFLNNSSIGLYARLVVGRERLQHGSRLGKWSAMVRAGWSVLQHPRSFSLALRVDGQDLCRRTPFVFVGNNDYVVEGVHSGERSRLDEGALSIYVLRPSGPWGLLLLAMRAIAGRIVHGRDLDQLHATSLQIESRHAQVEGARDGEVGMLDTPLRYRIRPRSLQVIAPPPGESTR